MDDIFGFIIFVLIFVLGPVIEQIRRKQQQPPRPQQRPRLPDQQQTPSQTPARTTSTSSTEEVSAATMLPDELWEVLTGQPRPSGPSRPLPAPVPAPDVEEEAWEEEGLIAEDVQVETRRTQREEGVSLEKISRHEVPVVVSMETMPAAPAVRHAAFHARIDQAAAPARVTPVSNMPPLRGRKALRQAMLMQAVLGKPKALE